MKGFTLLELLVVVLIMGILSALAMPYYFNAVENARMTEVVLLWGRQKNFIAGRFLDTAQAERTQKSIQNAKLKNYAGTLVCRPKGNAQEPCWEAVFTQTQPSPHAAYKLTTTDNFARLACIGLNKAGKNFCDTQSHQDPISLDGEQAFLIR